MTTMHAAVLHGAHDLRVEEVDRPEIAGVDEVLLKVELTAICGTDLHPYEGRMDLEDGVILGHEFVGTIEAAGSAVGQFSEGDKVVASCVVNCGHCWSCRKNDPAHCAGSRIFGMGIALGDLPGGQAEYVVVPNADEILRRIEPDSTATDENLLFAGDIMTTGYEAVRRAYSPGDTVAIVGAGPVGLCAAMAAKALGASQVVVVDQVASRVAEAQRFGAIGINAKETDPADAVLDLTNWRGADVVIDAVGHESALLTACSLVRSGGSISIPGVYIEDAITIPFGELWLKGVTIYNGVAKIVNYMDEVMALTEAGVLDPARIISHRLPLSDAAKAYELFEAREATKILLDPSA